MTAADLHAAAKAAYWQDKDLRKAIELAQKGIRAAADAGDQGEEKAINYDLASFCWPGWDESGIQIHSSELALGATAADRNLELAIVLNRPAVAMANAHFMVGAYHLAYRRLSEAKTSFIHFQRFAEDNHDLGQIRLADGYLALTAILAQAADGEARFENIVENLRTSGVEHGPFFANQLVAAKRIFGR